MSTLPKWMEEDETLHGGVEITREELLLRKCVICRAEYEPTNSMQVACSPAHAKEHRRRAVKAYKTANPTKIKQLHADWRAANPDKAKALAKKGATAFRNRHRDQIREGDNARKKDRYAADPAFKEAIRQRNKKYYEKRKQQSGS